MKLRCEECGNMDLFTATAQTEIDVIIDGSGNILDPRASQQTLDNIVVVRPWKCNLCGTANKIIDLEEGTNDSAAEVPSA
jgi:hypothetical protein